MSEAYDVAGVTVTPQAGGYYELSHPSLAAPEKVRGKEAADARAAAIAAEASPADGSIAPQPPIDNLELPQAGGVDAPVVDVAALTELVKRQGEMIDKLLAAQATTVVAGDTAPQADPLATMPRKYNGQASDAQREAAAKLGVEYVTIILEENPDIPPTGLFLGHNGNGYVISPGEPVDVPDFLLGVLDHAIMSSPITDSKTQKVLGYRDRMRYPYRRV